MHPHQCDAIILHHLDYGEADRIVTFLAPELGIGRGMARHARNSRKRFGPALDTFARVRLHYSAGRGDLLTLREAELIDLRDGLRRNYDAITLAAYGCELVEALCGQSDDHSDTFLLLEAFLDYLNRLGPTPEARLLLELRLLFHAGYAPHLLHCAECNAQLAGEEILFDVVRNGSLCRTCAPTGATQRVALGTLGTLARIARTPLTAFDNFRLSPRTLDEGGAILAAALRLHLTRPLKSAAFVTGVAPHPNK